MAGYQDQAAQVITDMMDRFDQAAHIPALSEMCSNMLVLSAEQNFETTNPKKSLKSRNSPRFSPEQRDAYFQHEKVCREWRLAGRPIEKSHPAKIRKLESQRNLQKIAIQSDLIPERAYL